MSSLPLLSHHLFVAAVQPERRVQRKPKSRRTSGRAREDEPVVVPVAVLTSELAEGTHAQSAGFPAFSDG